MCAVTAPHMATFVYGEMTAASERHTYLPTKLIEDAHIAHRVRLGNGQRCAIEYSGCEIIRLQRVERPTATDLKGPRFGPITLARTVHLWPLGVANSEHRSRCRWFPGY